MPVENLPAPNQRSRDILGQLDRAVYERILAGESALRIALTHNLIPRLEDWYPSAVQTMRDEINRVQSGARYYGDRSLFKLLNSTPYASKIIWFRIAYEKSNGGNYLQILRTADTLSLDPYAGTNYNQLIQFGETQPFPFRNTAESDAEFRKYVWCLHFVNDNGAINGITSLTARALKVVNELTEEEAISPESSEYSLLENGQDVCLHIRKLLEGAGKADFKEFVRVLKNRAYLPNVPLWLEELYQSTRRVLIGFRRTESERLGRPDTLPEVALDDDGQIVLVRPDIDSYDDETYSLNDKFLFYRPNEHTAWAEWKYCGGGVFDGGHRFIKLGKLGRVEFQSADSTDDKVELLKYLLTDKYTGIALYSVRPSESAACRYSLGRKTPVIQTDRYSDKLRENEYYKIVFVNAASLPVLAFSTDHPEGIELPLNEFAFGDEKTDVFRIPKGTLEIKIGETRFPIADSRIDWLVHTQKLSCVRNSRGGSVGFHFFYNKTTYPLLNLQGATGVWYEYEGVRHPVEYINCEWSADSEWLWRHDGKLVIASNGYSDRSFPVTFVDVDFSSLEIVPHPMGAAFRTEIRLGEESLEVKVGANDIEVEVEYKGFHFRPRVNRLGVLIQTPYRTIAATQGWNPQVDIAIDDLEGSDSFLYLGVPAPNEMIISYEGKQFELETLLDSNNKVRFSRIFDFGTIRYDLPVKCRIRHPKTYEVYSFVIYDPKAALLIKGPQVKDERRVVIDRISGSKDLYIRYFSSYRHHETENRIELAFVPAHRQDTEPKYYPLEDRMLGDDPEGRGRCVESVVAKNFFSQPMDWGHGVIGFVVERGRYRTDVQTSAFFILALNPQPPTFENDILKDLRIVLSEQQVRRGRRMTEEEKCRLHRIEQEFMTKDPLKRDAIDKYIRQAATVASNLNALECLNSFCNGIRTFNGYGAWVSGYVFMAGWFVKHYVKNEELEEWPFPRFWHPYLISYEYSNPTEPLPQGVVSNIRNEVRRAISNTNSQEFSGLKFKVWKLIRRIFTRDETIDTFSEGSQINHREMISFPYHYDNYTEQKAYTYDIFFKLLERIGWMLNAWCRHPTLNEPLLQCGRFYFTLQDLREFLLLVDDFDAVISPRELFCRILVKNEAMKQFENDQKSAN